VLDEPLAILAAFQWVNKNAHFSLFECLRHDIERHSKRKNSFEAYLAFHLRKVFETSPELDAVFTFRDDFARRMDSIPWQHEQFELVTVVATADRNNPRISVVTPSCGSSSNIGFLADSGEEVLEWISTNKYRFTFCFPQALFGPDLLFFVRSKVSGGLLLVAIQAKKYDIVECAALPLLGFGKARMRRCVTLSTLFAMSIDLVQLQHLTANAAPFLRNDNNDCSALATQTKDVLANIPLGLKVEDADYPVLRVFASWEGEAKLARTIERKEKKPTKKKQKNAQKGEQRNLQQEAVVESISDRDRHPLATLHLGNFRKFAQEFDWNWFREDVEQQLVVPSRRACQDVEPLRVRKSAQLERRLFPDG
jgi:hypothetical protein